MKCPECPHCNPSLLDEEPRRYGLSGLSPLSKHPKLWYFLKWSSWLFVLWFSCSITKPGLYKAEDEEYFDFDLSFAWPSDWQSKKPLTDKRIISIFGIYVVLYLHALLRGYSEVISGYKKVNGKISGNAKMGWLKNDIEENGYRLAAFHREHYDGFSTKLRIAYYLVNPKGYHGVGFCHTEGIYQSLCAMILGYSFLVGADDWLEANLKAMNPEYTTNPNPPGNISTTFVVFVFLVGFGLCVYMSLSFGRQLGWQFGIRRFIEELRNELGSLGGSFPKEEWMESWISKFLTEKDLEHEDDLKCVKKCIDAIVKDISS